MNIIKNWLEKRKQNKRKEMELLVSYSAAEARYYMWHEMLSGMSLDDLESIVEAGKKNRLDPDIGHTDYSQLAKTCILIGERRKKEREELGEEVLRLKQRNIELEYKLRRLDKTP